MRLRRLTPIALSSALLLLATLGAAPASAAPAAYVALGDSYASGDGAGSYDPASGGCLRSTNAYPATWAAAHAPASFTSVACAGATTTDVLSSQLSAVASGTTLVSITIGGNDVGFSNIMQTCVLGSDSACLSAVSAGEQYADTQLPPALRTLFAAVHGRAPAAHVVVVDYPHLYTIVSFCIGLDNTKRTALNQGADHLDAALAKGAADAGFTFADVRSQFAGHELCSGQGWLHSITIPIGESYHPTATGQNLGYLPVFTAVAG